MRNNPLHIFNITEKKSKKIIGYEVFAGPYRATETQFLFNVIADAVRMGHQILLVGTEDSKRLALTVFLKRRQHPDEQTLWHDLFVPIDIEDEQAELICERQITPLEGISIVARISSMGHTPIVTKTKNGATKISMKRNILDKPE